MKPLGLEKIYGTDVWERHYGEIFNNPRKIINQVFDPNFESLHYPDQIPSILKANIGTKKTDELLVDVYYEFKNKYPDENNVPRPPHWSGWSLKPERIEFWLEIKNRIHERLNYKKENKNWVKEILYP